MKKVLLTGATGLIGQYSLKPLLDAGFEVFAVSSNEKTLGNHINWIKADLLNFEEIKKVFEEIKPEYSLEQGLDRIIKGNTNE
ncbi:MAG: NAD-dependent epimerase/dehydratase family protein [bacterium]